MLVTILTVGWLISLICIVHLWRTQRARWFRKIFWSLVLIVPYLGPLFYSALFHPLPPQAEHCRARENPDVYSVTPGDLH